MASSKQSAAEIAEQEFFFICDLSAHQLCKQAAIRKMNYMLRHTRLWRFVILTLKLYQEI